MVKQGLTQPSRCGASRAGGQLTAAKGFWGVLHFPEGKRPGCAGCQCVWARACSPGQHCSVGAAERWPKLGCGRCTAVRVNGSWGKVSTHEPKAWGNKGCIVWKTTLAGCLALKRFAKELESCPQPSLLSVRKFYRSWKAAMSFFSTVPCLYMQWRTCTAVIPCALDQRLGVSPGRVASASDFSSWCGNAGAHNGCDSKTNASSLLLITLAETPWCLETTDGADLGSLKKKKGTHNLRTSFFFFLNYVLLSL